MKLSKKVKGKIKEFLPLLESLSSTFTVSFVEI